MQPPLFTHLSPVMRRTIWMAALVIAGLHGVELNQQSAWGDEATSVALITSSSLSAAFSLIQRTSGSENLTQAYLWVLWFWHKINGGSVVWLRLLSVLAFWGALWFGHRLWRSRGETAVGKCFVLTLALHPFWWFYSQEIRGYALSLVLILATLVVHHRSLSPFAEDRAPLRTDLLLGFLLGCAVGTNFYCILIWPVLALADFAHRRGFGARRVARRFLLMGLFTFPWLLNYLVISSQVLPASGFARPFTLSELAGLVHMTVFGTSWGTPIAELRLSRSIWEAVLPYWPFYAFSGMATALFLTGAVRVRAWKDCAIETGIAVLSVGAIAWLSWRHGYPAAPRHLFLLTPALLGWIAVVLARRPLYVLPLLGCFILSSLQYLFHPSYARENWRDALATLQEAPHGIACPVVFTQADRFVFDLYLSNHQTTYRWNHDAQHEEVHFTDGTVPFFQLFKVSEWREPATVPDFLIEARTWELDAKGRTLVQKMKKRMVPFYEATGVTIWRRPTRASPFDGRPLSHE